MEDESKRHKLGAKAGRKSLVLEENAEFLVQSAVRADRGNDGQGHAEVIVNLMELQPELNPGQEENYVKWTWKAKHIWKLKPRPVKAQKNTSKRSEYTVVQQYCWFKNIDKACDFLWRKNAGLYRLTKKSSGEVINHFIVASDEINL